MAALGLQTAPDIRKARRLVVKIGSALLVDRVTGLKTAWLTALALDVAEAKARGADVVLVSSGSIALGRKVLGLPDGALQPGYAGIRPKISGPKEPAADFMILGPAEHGVPGIYRSQASLAPGIKVRMGTKALPHAGIGVPSYAWSTSPLRRYTDLVNQWQIIACAKHGATAAFAAPFKPKDAELFSIISGFDATYSAYNSVQSSMERYWTLRHVQQQGIEELDASLVKEMGGGTWLVQSKPSHSSKSLAATT